MRLIPTILCGGVGSRLWPVSREFYPKPFFRLADGESLLQKTFLRSAALPGAEEILVVTKRELFFETRDEFYAINKKNVPASFILEPFGRNTAAALAAAALYLTQKYHDEDILMLALPADHLISHQQAFSQAVTKATALAQKGKLVTFGIHPDGPETGYGYIEVEGNTVLDFVEKPSLSKAQEYFESGRFLWNSGMFCFKTSALLREMEHYCPDILTATKLCVEQSTQTQSKNFTQLELDPKTFEKVPEDSIDYAVMEKSHQLAIVPCDIGWSDIGSWDIVCNLTEPDTKGNRIRGDALLHDSVNCYVQSHERLVSAVGVEDLIIIDTPDALLIVNKSHTQKVKNLYNELKVQNHETHKFHPTRKNIRSDS
jgi:mannose-1-phosphate guanylyltransferase/mannose-6-phosphate isomerase